MDKTAALLARLARLGFQVSETGGGCTALDRAIGNPDGTNTLQRITENQGCSTPEWGDTIIVGEYQSDEHLAIDDGDEGVCYQFKFTLADGTYALALGDAPWKEIPQAVLDVLRALQEIAAEAKPRPVTITVDARHLRRAIGALYAWDAMPSDREAAEALEAALRPFEGA